MEKKRYKGRFFRHAISAPIIYFMIIPLVMFDLFLEIYHQICFRLYSLPIVRRRDYIRIDRHRLSYLNWFEKMNCAYCGYGNGLINYASVILANTESYWCGIKHDKYKGFHAPKHHKNFSEYGNAKDFKKKYG